MVTLRKNKGSALTYDEMDQNQVEAAHRVAGSSISEDLSLSGKQSSILIGDDITIASGKTVTLRDSASIDIINPEDAKSLSLRKPIQAPGSIVQVQYYQITETNTVQFTVGNTGVATAMQVDNISSASRITLPRMVSTLEDGNVGVFSVVITPKYSNSVIKIEAMVNGEWTDDTYTFQTGWGFARQVDGGMTFLKADPFETRLACVAPTSRSHYNDNDASTPECANYSYFDIPNTAKSIRYHVTCLGNNNNTFRVNRTADDGSDHQRFTSFISATEIAQ
jgi:hypothetical protein